MSMSCNLTLVDDVLLKNMVTGKEFTEFSNAINELEILVGADIYTEAVRDTSPSAKKFMGVVKKNTWDTTKDVGKVYGDIISGNANVMKATWDLVVKIIHTTVKVLKFILDKIASVPKLILKVGAKVSDISVELRSKISGNITLHITAGDIEMIYNKLFMRHLTSYINDASNLSKGEFWGTFMNKRKEVVNLGHNTVTVKENDIKTCKRMMSTFGHLQSTEFRPTIINLKDKNNVNIYFGADKLINFTDLYGKKHQLSYYEALNKIIEDLNAKKSELETIHSAIGDKLKQTELNQTYAKLGSHDKYLLNTTLSQIGKVSSIVGNFVKYIMSDLNTINGNIDKILGVNGTPAHKK